MRIFVLVLFILCITDKVYSQYECYQEVTDNGGRIEITGDTLRYIVPRWNWDLCDTDTMAVCSFKRIDDEFIELNTISDYDKVIEAIRIVQSNDCSVSEDSVRIHFSIKNPAYYSGDNGIKINTYNADLSYFSYNREFVLPKNFEKFDFIIYTSTWPHKLLDIYYNLRLLQSPVYMFDKRCNDVEIRFPYRVYRNYSDRYYVKGEYARIQNDMLFWKDRIFVRCDKLAK